MKTITLITIGFLFAAFLTSCEKCGTCTVTTTTTVNVSTPGYPQTTVTTFDACGDELKNAHGTTTTSTVTSGGIRATSRARTVCTLK